MVYASGMTSQSKNYTISKIKINIVPNISWKIYNSFQKIILKEYLIHFFVLHLKLDNKMINILY